MTLLSGDRVALLTAATAESGQQHVLFDRDETDSYRIRLEPIHAQRRQLTRAEVMPALPVGSRWADAVGWESYVVFPIAGIAGQDAVAIVGLEYVVAHVSRGAYAVFAGAVVPVTLVRSAVDAIAKELDPDNNATVASTYGVVVSNARSLEQHRGAAAWMLRAAGSAYSQGDRLTVRTVLLTQDEVPPMRKLVWSRGRGTLLGVVPPLRDHFSGSANKVLGLLTSKLFHTEPSPA